jgi:H+-transporting ATPase
MKAIADQPKAAESKPGSKPDSKDDLKTLPLPEVEKKWGSPPNGLSQAETQKRLTQYGPNEIEEKKTNPFLKFLTYFWGPIPWIPDALGDGEARYSQVPGNRRRLPEAESGPSAQRRN